jgi:OPA family glycerol-3-phosphate transporter-like MFS transporter 3
MGVTGVFIGGPANLISAAVSADLGRSPSIAGNAEALSTVTGVVDGTGSVGAALGQLLIPALEHATGNWQYVFYMFIAMVRHARMCAHEHSRHCSPQSASYHS